ncbi:MAG: hypothetical protein QOH59_741, partial [Gemmatimonadales bacterium]|nr:hypothetical protein [Gemmatimonadales bacterium]
LLPFAAVGVFTALTAMQRAAARNWTEALFLGLFAVTFGGVGLGGIAAALVGRRKLKEQAALEASHPDSPWLWRQDWASGRIIDSSRATMFTAWIFAAFWNVVSFPTGFLGVRAAIQEAKPAALLAVLFPLVGIGFVVWAMRATMRYRKYGVSRLELSTIPGVVGRTLTGMVRAPARMQPVDGFQITLSCVRRVTNRSGKNSSTSESIIWQDERRVAGEPTRTSVAMETHIPVAFRLPADSVACDDTNPNNRVLWRLQLSAEVPGVDYGAQFEVPVFRTSASDQPLSQEEERITQDPLAGTDYEQPADSRIVVTSNRRGTEVLFPAARNPGAATSLTFFLLLWLGCIALQMYFRAPLIFPIVTGLFGLLIFIGVLDLWLTVSRVTVDAGTLTWATGYLVPGRERTLHASEVADVIAAIGMQAGTTVYYDVAVVRKNGKKIKVGSSLRNKREAEWLAGRIRQALGSEKLSS